MRTIPAFDWKIRAFHWSLVAIVFLNQFVLETGAWHNRIGYAACALIGARLLLGESSRFKSRGYAMNAVIGLMVALVLFLGVTGWMLSWDRYFGEEWLEELHENVSWVLIGLVAAHVSILLRPGIKRGSKLIGLMIRGQK